MLPRNATQLGREQYISGCVHSGVVSGVFEHDSMPAGHDVLRHQAPRHRVVYVGQPPGGASRARHGGRTRSSRRHAQHSPSDST